MQESLQSGRYKLLRKLGKGGMGAVFEAFDTRRDQRVAIKLIESQELDEKSLARFKREAQTMTMLSHPNIVSVLDSGEEGNNRFLVMEFIEGQSLKEYLAGLPDRRVNESLALNMTRQVAQAVGHAHSQGILHRDIKPANIMIGPDQQARLTDFGIAKTLGLSTLTQTGDVLGTAAYMAPEQALGAELDARSDLYSLGCVLYEMYVGQRPFPGDNAARLIFSHINDMPCLPRRVAMEISPALEAMIFTLLAKDPNQRYQSAADLLRAIEGVEAQSEPQAIAIQAVERRWAQVVVGRDSESALLRQRLDAILRQEGSLLLLNGEAGIGKSRLAHQLEVYASMRGARFYVGRARHHQERIPYQPWIDILQRIVRLTSQAIIARSIGGAGPALVKLVPELIEQMDEPADAPAVPPDQQRHQLFEAITQFLVNLSKNDPFVLFLDDLHWADETSLHLLHHVAHRIQSEPILLIGAYRDDALQVEEPLMRIMAEMEGERLSETVPLKRLDADQTTEKIRKTLGGQELAELEAHIYRKSGGNPFFIEELVRSLLASEHLLLVEGQWQVKELAQTELPDTIQMMVGERLRRVSEAGRDVLTLAAVIGMEFSFAALHALVDRDEESLVELLDEALRAQVLVARRAPGQEQYAFADALVRDVLYEAISPVRRPRHHLRAAQALEQIHGANLDPWLEALAFHFLAANDAPKSAEYAIRAGDKAAELYAWSEAEERYQAALKLLGPEETPIRAMVHEKLAAVTTATSDADASLANLESALELYMVLGDKRKEMEMHMAIQAQFTAGFWDGAREDEALKHLEAAATIAEGFPESVEQGLMYQRMAHLHLHRAQIGAALSHAQKAVGLFARVGTPMGTALGTALAYTGQLDEGVAYSEGNWQGVQKLNNPLVTVVFGHEITLTIALARNIPKAREWGEKVLAEAGKAGPVFEGFLRRPLLLVYILSGETDKGAELCRIQEEIEKHTLAGCYFEDAAAVGLHYLSMGEGARARAYLERAIALHQQRNTVIAVAGCSLALGNLSLEEEKFDEADAYLRRCLDIGRTGGNVLLQLWTLPLLAELSLRLGALDQARDFVESCFDLLSPGQNWYGLPAPVYLAQGMLASARKKWDEAAAAFERALAINRQYECLRDEAKTLYQWGLMLGQRRDKASAHEKLDEALTLFQRMRAGDYVRKTESAAERLEESWLVRVRQRLARE